LRNQNAHAALVASVPTASDFGCTCQLLGTRKPVSAVKTMYVFYKLTLKKLFQKMICVVPNACYRWAQCFRIEYELHNAATGPTRLANCACTRLWQHIATKKLHFHIF